MAIPSAIESTHTHIECMLGAVVCPRACRNNSQQWHTHTQAEQRQKTEEKHTLCRTEDGNRDGQREKNAANKQRTNNRTKERINDQRLSELQLKRTQHGISNYAHTITYTRAYQASSLYVIANNNIDKLTEKERETTKNGYSLKSEHTHKLYH